jgi:hypothetical protein
MAILNNVTVLGTGLYAAQTLQAEFLRGGPSYVPAADPRLPKHDTITSNLTIFTNASITVSNIALFPVPNPTSNVYGAVRVREEVILYGTRHAGNSTLGNLTRNVANTPNSTVSGNVRAGNVISVLGLRTVSS